MVKLPWKVAVNDMSNFMFIVKATEGVMDQIKMNTDVSKLG